MDHPVIRSFRFSSLLLMCIFAVGTLWINACKDSRPSESEATPTARVRVPSFNEDTAYYFIEKQLSFGHRIPGSDASVEMRTWMTDLLTSYGASMHLQPFRANFLDQKDVEAVNVIASFNPTEKRRILLCAHYDSRLIAEKDPDQGMRNKPIMGADDGASGTAVLLEIARIIGQNPVQLGVDMVFFDAEDQGDNDGPMNTWCLGSQYWSKNPHIRGYKAEFGILLDMVGAEGVRFGKEGWSRRYAGEIVDKVWNLAQAMGYGDYFQNVNVGEITDDHYYINVNMGIPTIDIINTPAPGGGFGHYHHTHKDDIQIISRRTLKVAGQVVTAVVYKTSDFSL